MEMTAIETVDATPTGARFTIDAKRLADALAFMAGRIIEKRNTVPILSNVVLVAWPGRVDLLANDRELMARICIPADTLAPGAFTVDAAALLAIAKKAGAGARLEMVQDDGRVIVDTGTSRARLPMLPADDFPLPAPIGGNCHRFTLSAEFMADIARVAPFICTEESRYYLNGIALQRRQLAGRDRLLIAATNGRELSAWSRPVPDGAGSLPDVILPAKLVKALQAMLKITGESGLSAEFDRAGLVTSLECGPVFLQSKLIDGTFPDVETVAAGSIGDAPAQPLLIPELDPDMNPATLERMAKATGAALSWENVGSFMLAIDPANPDWFGMAGKGGMPKGYAVDYHQAHQAAAAYLADLASKRGLDVGKPENHKLIVNGEDPGIVRGLTVGEEVYIPASVDYVQDWEALTMREIRIDARWEYAEGSYSVPMPRERQKMEAACSLTVDGETYPLATNSRGDIHLSKEAVRKIIGESCFETMAVTLPDGRPAFILQWLWDEGCTRFCTVRADGRCATGKGDEGAAGVMVTRGEILAAMAGPIAAMESPAPIDEPAPTDAEMICEALRSEFPGQTFTVRDYGGGNVKIVGNAGEPQREWSTPADGGHDEAMARARDIAEFLIETEAKRAARAAKREILAAEPCQPESATAERPDPASTPDSPILPPAGEIAPGDDLAARLDALEMAVKALQAVQAAPVAGDVAQARPKRTPAHERAIRRAWQERCARRAAAFNLKVARMEREAAQTDAETWKRSSNQHFNDVLEVMHKREASSTRARRMIAAYRANMHAMRQTADQANAGLALAIDDRNAARAELASLKRSLADPANPLRVDDATRLIDDARAAKARCTMLEQQNAQMKAMTQRGADQLEAMISRVTRAEAALRAAGLLSAPLALVAPDQVAA